MQTYIIKVEWDATALLLNIEAKDEGDAIQKALKRKDTKGCYKIKVLEVR